MVTIIAMFVILPGGSRKQTVDSHAKDGSFINPSDHHNILFLQILWLYKSVTLFASRWAKS